MAMAEANQGQELPTIGSPKNQVERSFNRVQSMIIPVQKGRNITLRPESPRTEQAMIELGFEKDYFKPKLEKLNQKIIFKAFSYD